MFVVGTAGFRLAGSADQVCSSDVPFGSRRTPVEATTLNSPANGAWIAPNVSHGELARSSASRCLASSGVAGAGLLPPSMYASPERPFAPGVPLKSQVA